MIFDVFHLEISGKDINEQHPENKQHIFVILPVINFEISFKDINEEHPENKQLISVTFLIHFHYHSNLYFEYLY